MFAAYSNDFPEDAAAFERVFIAKELPADWKNNLPTYVPGESANKATRNYGGDVINKIAEVVPELIGGSADLTPSNKTQLKCSSDFQAATPAGRYFRFGVR